MMWRLLLPIALLSGLVFDAQARGSIVVDKDHMTLTLVQDGDTLMHCPISCGRGWGQKQKDGDMRTPEGDFRIVAVTDSRSWGHDFGDGQGYIRQAYGPWFVRLNAGHGIGIHGTHDPASMGLRASEGCIRLRNDDLLALYPHLLVGMPVRILPDTFQPLPAPPVGLLAVPESQGFDRKNDLEGKVVLFGKTGLEGETGWGSKTGLFGKNHSGK